MGCCCGCFTGCGCDGGHDGCDELACGSGVNGSVSDCSGVLSNEGFNTECEQSNARRYPMNSSNEGNGVGWNKHITGVRKTT